MSGLRGSEFTRRGRATEVVALKGITAQCGQLVALRSGLHALGNDGESQTVAQRLFLGLTCGRRLS